jgi:hypothetical protein
MGDLVLSTMSTLWAGVAITTSGSPEFKPFMYGPILGQRGISPRPSSDFLRIQVERVFSATSNDAKPPSIWRERRG